MSKYNKKRLTKKDLKDMPLDRVMKDMEIVNNLVDKISNYKIDESLEEESAENFKNELKEVEKYLKGQYGKYIDDSFDLDNIDDIDDIIK